MSDLSLDPVELAGEAVQAAGANRRGARLLKRAIVILLGLTVGLVVGAVVAVFMGLLPFLC